jgi:hypothetical protein
MPLDNGKEISDWHEVDVDGVGQFKAISYRKEA